MFNIKAMLPQINKPRYLAKIIWIGLNDVSNISNEPSSTSDFKKFKAPKFVKTLCDLKGQKITIQ